MYGYICIPVCFVYFQEVVRGVAASQIRGLGFDATCSLVVVDKQLQPLAVNSEGGASLKTWCYCCVLPLMGVNFPCSPNAEWWG